MKKIIVPILALLSLGVVSSNTYFSAKRENIKSTYQYYDKNDNISFGKLAQNSIKVKEIKKSISLPESQEESYTKKLDNIRTAYKLAYRYNLGNDEGKNIFQIQIGVPKNEVEKVYNEIFNSTTTTTFNDKNYYSLLVCTDPTNINSNYLEYNIPNNKVFKNNGNPTDRQEYTVTNLGETYYVFSINVGDIINRPALGLNKLYVGYHFVSDQKEVISTFNNDSASGISFYSLLSKKYLHNPDIDLSDKDKESLNLCMKDSIFRDNNYEYVQDKQADGITDGKIKYTKIGEKYYDENFTEVTDTTEAAPWKTVPLTGDYYIEIPSNHKKGNSDELVNKYAAEFSVSENDGASYKGYYNGGIAIKCDQFSEGRNVLSITVVATQISWGRCFYMRAYSENSLGENNQVLPVTQFYNGPVNAGITKFYRCGGRVLDQNGNQVTTINNKEPVPYTYEIDLTPYLNGKNLKVIHLWSAYSDSDEENNYINAPTLKVLNTTFKETLCNHSRSRYETKLVTKTSEYDSTYTYGVCTVCGCKDTTKNVLFKAGKDTVNLYDYTSLETPIEVTSNSIICNQTENKTRKIVYTIPSKYIGKGKLVLTISINSVFNGHDIRLIDSANKELVKDFGQVYIASTGKNFPYKLNNEYKSVNATLEDNNATTCNANETLTNRYITYIFDLSDEQLNTAMKIQFLFWYGNQTLSFKDFYFIDNCSHEQTKTTTIVKIGKNAQENIDGCTRTFCDTCGQMIVENNYDRLDKKKMNVSQIINLDNKPGQEAYLSNFIEHIEERPYFVIKMRMEHLQDNKWVFYEGWTLYINLLSKNNSFLPIGLYLSNSGEEETKIQVHSGTGTDARTLYPEPNKSTGGEYGKLPKFITNKFDKTDNSFIWTFDLTDETAKEITGLAFRAIDSTGKESFRMNILDAYTSKYSLI